MLDQTCFLTGLGRPWTNIQRVMTPSGNDGYVVNSQVCGTYYIHQNLCGPEPENPQMISYLKTLYVNDLHILAGFTLRRSEEGKPVELGRDNIDKILRGISIPKGPLEQIDLILSYLYQQYANGKSPESYLQLYEHKIARDIKYTIAYAKGAKDFTWLINKALEFGYLESDQSLAIQPPQNIRLSLKGFDRVQELQKSKNSSQVFVAMSFGLDDAVFEEGINKALEDTGYSAMFLKSEIHNEKIDDKIIVEIRKSRFVIVDVTDHRPNVYFEAGFALGEGIPVLWTCRENDWNEHEAHFDTRQYNYLLWENAEDLREKLRYRIEAIFGSL